MGCKPVWQAVILSVSIQRKLRMPQVQGVRSQAVVNYCELLATQEMGYHRLSRRVNKMRNRLLISCLIYKQVLEDRFESTYFGKIPIVFIPFFILFTLN